MTQFRRRARDVDRAMYAIGVDYYPAGRIARVESLSRKGAIRKVGTKMD